MDQYLQLPGDITPRTKDLAKKIASDITSPYDIANAVTQYLRTNIVYELSIDQPPPKQERIDWFLFDYQRGFCNYYASAEVILLRTLGIPARMAVGFAQGERKVSDTNQPPIGVGPVSNDTQSNDTSTYVVRQKDAHAWPEVFFPGIGWVEFEPTVSQPDIARIPGNISETEQDPLINQFDNKK